MEATATEQAVVHGVMVDFDISDVHMRFRTDRESSASRQHYVDTGRYLPCVAWCGVYVRPTEHVAGYWYESKGEDAVALVLRFA